MKKLLLAVFFALSLNGTSFPQDQGTTDKPLMQGEMPILQEDSARMLVKSGKSEYSGDENIVLSIVLKNEGTKPFRIIFDDVDFFYDIEVANAAGKKLAFLPLHERRRRGSNQGMNLKPGETEEAVLWLSHLFNLTSQGKYKVTVSKNFRLGKDILKVSSQPFEFKVISDPSVGGWQ